MTIINEFLKDMISDLKIPKKRYTNVSRSLHKKNARVCRPQNRIESD